MTTGEDRRVEEEIRDLQHEIDHFKKEKERVRRIVGQIGGLPKTRMRIVNVVFVVLVLACLAVSIVSKLPKIQLAMVELAVAAVTVKLIVLMNHQVRVTHFQLWILSSLEWQVNEVMKAVRQADRASDRSSAPAGAD
ncbi:MAG: hypothetical protein JXR37_26790 [Kiritimatiellae bacterium]|nr:hypothetical protein [Kiritimatiellia bacterium]